MWGTVGSGLTPGSRQDRKKSGFPDSGSGNPEKPENREKNHVTPHFKALGQLVNVDMLKIRFSGFLIREIRKTEIHSFVARRATTRELVQKFLNQSNQPKFVARNFFAGLLRKKSRPTTTSPHFQGREVLRDE